MGSDGGDGNTSLGGLEKALTELQKQTAADKEQEAKDLSEAVAAREKSLAELKAELMGADGGDGKTSLGGLEKALTELQKQTAADKEQEAKELSEAVTGCEKSLAELKAELMGAEGEDSGGQMQEFRKQLANSAQDLEKRSTANGTKIDALEARLEAAGIQAGDGEATIQDRLDTLKTAMQEEIAAGSKAQADKTAEVKTEIGTVDETLSSTSQDLSKKIEALEARLEAA